MVNFDTIYSGIFCLVIISLAEPNKIGTATKNSVRQGASMYFIVQSVTGPNQVITSNLLVRLLLK